MRLDSRSQGDNDVGGAENGGGDRKGKGMVDRRGGEGEKELGKYGQGSSK